MERQVCPQRDAALCFLSKYWQAMTGKFDFRSARYANQEVSPTQDESSQLREYLALLRVNPRLKLIYRCMNYQGMKIVTPHHESSKSTLTLSPLIRE